jgi:dienelactone hydrolase
MVGGQESSSGGIADRDETGDLAALFEYDTSVPLELEEVGVQERNGVQVHDLTYAGLQGERTVAFWMVPPGRDRFPAVVFVHPSPGNRSSFFDEGIRLGGLGIGSLLIDAPWSAGEAWVRRLGTPEQNRELFTGIIRDLRRAVDFVVTQPGVDPMRLAYVGHSFGALFGGVLSGVERRLGAFVLMAGAPSFTDVAVANMPTLAGDELEHYRTVNEAIDPVRFVRHAAPAYLFFQCAERDQIFSRETAEAFADAGSEPKVVRWYDTDHYFSSEEAKRDRIEWLHTRLGGGYRRMKGKTGRAPPSRR